MLVDPNILTLLVSSGIFGCAFMIGRNSGMGIKDDTIENTINHLIDEGFLRYKRKSNGELEILKLDD